MVANSFKFLQARKGSVKHSFTRASVRARAGWEGLGGRLCPCTGREGQVWACCGRPRPPLLETGSAHRGQEAKLPTDHHVVCDLPPRPHGAAWSNRCRPALPRLPPASRGTVIHLLEFVSFVQSSGVGWCLTWVPTRGGSPGEPGVRPPHRPPALRGRVSPRLTLQVHLVQLSTTHVSFSAKNRPSCQQADMFLVLGGPPMSSQRNWLSLDWKVEATFQCR